jgi:hypothetical protein
MPRDGALRLSDIHEPTLPVVCEACGWFVIYRVEKLMAQYGDDADLTNLPHALPDCPMVRSRGRCKAVCVGLARTAGLTR